MVSMANVNQFQFLFRNRTGIFLNLEFRYVVEIRDKSSSNPTKYRNISIVKNVTNFSGNLIIPF